MFRKIISLILAACLTCALAGCGERKAPDAPVAGTAAGEFEGYYSQLSYEVYNDDGTVAEQMYNLCTDEDFLYIAGMKDVYFDADGNVSRYVVTMGMLNIEYVINYYTDGSGGTYYEKLYYNESGTVIKGEWYNNFSDPDGAQIRDCGSQEFYDDGRTPKSLTVERYTDGELTSKTVTEYDEDGNVTSESAE